MTTDVVADALRILRYILIVALAILAVIIVGSFRAKAQEIGRGLICDTKEQVERFVAEYNGDTEATVAAINGEVLPAACAIAPILYIRGERVSEVSGGGFSFEVVAIIVIGVVTPRGILHSQPLPQFTMFLLPGKEV